MSSGLVDMTSGQCVKCKKQGADLLTLSCRHRIDVDCLATQVNNAEVGASLTFTLARCPSTLNCILTWEDLQLVDSKRYLKSLARLAFFLLSRVSSQPELTSLMDVANLCNVVVATYETANAATHVPTKSKKAPARKYIYQGVNPLFGGYNPLVSARAQMSAAQSKGVGYGGSASSDGKLMASNVNKVSVRNRANERKLVSSLKDLLKAISQLQLPSSGLTFKSAKVTPIKKKRKKKHPSDERGSYSAVGYVLLHRVEKKLSLVDVLLAMWRNDSLMDIKTRIMAYRESLNLLERLASHSETAICFFISPETEAELEKSQNVSSGSKRKRQGNDKVALALQQDSTSDTLYSLIQKVRAQGAVFMKSQVPGAGEDKDNLFDFIARLNELCSSVEAYGKRKKLLSSKDDKSRRSVKRQRRALLEATGLTDEERKKAYCVALKELSFKAVALSDMISMGVLHHTFYNPASSIQQAVGSARTRLSRISRELSTLATSLPVSWGSSVFIRVDQDRPDMLIALIIGPKGTPYENGAFYFDIWLPANYPNGPPKVILTTTGGGTVRFNPNLYACGKVCLSLLGTWSGPGWRHTSTLLQVLVSIQALIMVEKPYFNEPGYERSQGTPVGERSSAAYNSKIQWATLKYGILGALLQPHALFKDVIKTHFTLKRQEVLAQCQAWKAPADLRRMVTQALNDLSQPVRSTTQSAPIVLDLDIPKKPQKPVVIDLDLDESEEGDNDVILLDMPQSVPAVSASETVDLT